MADDTYPDDRRGVWVLDFLKIMDKARIVPQVGATGVCLITAVALAEHVRDYLTPPDFWSSQLKDACGIADDDAFAACRARCVKSGWLFYRKGPYPRAAGIYWVRLPKELAGRIDALPRLNRGNAPVNTQGNTPANTQDKPQGNAPDKSPGNAPGNTPELPHPPHSHPSQGGEGKTAPPPPGKKSPDQAERDRKRTSEQIERRINRILLRHDIPANRECVTEWGTLLQDLAGCKTPDDFSTAIEWIIDRAKKEKSKAEGFQTDDHGLTYARKANRLIRAYAKYRSTSADGAT